MTTPRPLTPPDCDLRDFPRMMIDIPRLFGSEFDATASDSEWRFGVTLWLKSFHQVPAASLPDDDVQLARLCGLGRDVRSWRKAREVALRGWVKCDDGLLYHEVVAEVALEAWLDKLLQRLSSGAGNAARWNSDFDPAPIEAEIGVAACLLRSVNPKSRSLSKQKVIVALKRSDRQSPSALPAAIPPGSPEVPPGSQGKGREGNKGSEDKSSGGEPPLPGLADPNWTAWQLAVDLLTRIAGAPEKSARSAFGKLLSKHGLEARDMLPALAQAQVSETRDPMAYLTRAAEGVAKRRAPTERKRVGFV